jgi:riboflavin kinase/FMN adenylyltransferase
VRPVVVALGNFDGVHLGHRAVLRRAVEEGRRRGLRTVAATFEPHPRAVLWPGNEPKLLTTPEVRRELLLACGIDQVREIRFDGSLYAGVVVVGENFRFGHKASGDVAELRRCMREVGGEAYAVPISNVLGEVISSSRIRELVAEGKLREAARLLGRPYLMRGEVVEGDKRGRTIGFPTANVLPDERALAPGRGVYVGHARVGSELYGACTNVGIAPTFDRRESRIEAYLLSFDGDLYGEVVDVTFEERLRPEKRFSGIEELKEQIARDVEEAGDFLGERA